MEVYVSRKDIRIIGDFGFFSLLLVDLSLVRGVGTDESSKQTWSFFITWIEDYAERSAVERDAMVEYR